MIKKTGSIVVSLLWLALIGVAMLTPQMTFAQSQDEQESDQASSLQFRRNGFGAVFAMTNATAGNEIVIYSRANDGTLDRVGRVRTRGLASGLIRIRRDR